jgi:WD40 repeat protein
VLTWSEDNTARLWAIGADSEEPLQSFEHKGSVDGAVFSKDESRLLTWDYWARLWAIGADSKEPLQSFEDKECVDGALFSKDESRLLTWGEDGARLWASPRQPAIPGAELILKLEVLTASTIYGGRELRTLSIDAWLAKRSELDAIHAKAKED